MRLKELDFFLMWKVLAERSESMLIRVRCCLWFAGVLASIFNGHGVIQDGLEVLVCSPGKQHQWRVLVQPGVVLGGCKALAFLSRGMVDKSDRRGTDCKWKVEATDTCFVALQRLAVIDAMDDCTVLLTAIAKSAMVCSKVPTCVTVTVEKVTKEAVICAAR